MKIDPSQRPSPRSAHLLSAEQWRAATFFVERVLREVRADLIQASLFGSRARGDARPDSDVDILLVFRALPEDREPQASHAEEIAAEVAAASGVPVTAWSVSIPDLAQGLRTPMLVDALADAVPIWYADRPLPRLPFTPPDALWCADRLLTRVHEGGFEVASHLDEGRLEEAAKRGRDDVVRLCTALLLLRGITRPRRGAAAAVVLRQRRWSPLAGDILCWAIRSYGASGREEDGPVGAPPGGMDALLHVVKRLRGVVQRELSRPRRGSGHGT